MNSNQKRPISPNELFNSLMNGNYKQLECQSAMDRIHSEREILLNLIVEYEEQIDRRNRQAQEGVYLEGIKARLIQELARLRQDRLQIDQLQLQYQHRQTQLHQDNGRKNQLIAQLTEVRSRNSKIRVRIAELSQYILMLQQQNRRLQEERRILKMRVINGGGASMGGEDWRVRLDALKHSQQIYDEQIRTRMKEREQHAIRMKEEQQQAIRERNRVRMESFASNTAMLRQPPMRSLGKYRII